MPIIIDNSLPAAETLQNENIFVMNEDEASHQDIRSLRIALLNLMPTKIATETQILRLLGNSPLQVDIVLLHPATHVSKNTPQEHMKKFYTDFDKICGEKFDGLIITGAPVEEMPFEEVTYWDELKQIMRWSLTNVFSTFHICWGAQAGLYYHYGIQKHKMPAKLFGVFEHRRRVKYSKLLMGFDDVFFVPHSRYTEVRAGEVPGGSGLEILADSCEAGLYLAASRDGKQVFVTGHPEYDERTLADEYFRDVGKGLDIAVPKNYFENDDPARGIQVKWRGHGYLLYSNWLNYCVYQETPYDLSKI